jgi:hypothetical protein
MHLLSRIFLFIILPLFVSAVLVLHFINFEVKAQYTPSWENSNQTEVIRGKPYQILEVNLTFDKNSSSKIKTDSVIKRVGYAPKMPDLENAYSLELLSTEGKIISKTEFIPPTDVHGLPAEPGKEGKPSQGVVLDKVNFALTISLDSASRFRILSPEGSELLTQEIGTTEVKRGNGKYKSIKGSNVNKVSALSFNLTPKADAVESASDNYLDIAFVGDDYTDMNQFAQDAERAASFMVGLEPFKSRATQIYFHQVENTSDLRCYFHTDRIILCDYSSIYSAVNSSGVPYDKVIVLYNTPQYGGSGGDIAMSYNGIQEKEVVTHEFAHSLGLLLDEYTLYGQGPIDGRVQKNCYSGIPPASSWSNMVGKDDYALGCNYQNWYRPSQNSIMINLLSPWFNSPSQKALKDRMNFYAGSFSDPTPPVVNITSPANDTRILDNFTVETTATDNLGISQVQFWVNGVFISSKYLGPYSFTHQVNATDNIYNIQIKALDTAGNVSTKNIRLLADSDGDGFNDSLENFLGTNASRKCANNSTPNNESGQDAWPFDFDDNQIANTLDMGKYVAVLNSVAGDGKYQQRFDLNRDGRINTFDTGKYTSALNKKCI